MLFAGREKGRGKEARPRLDGRLRGAGGASGATGYRTRAVVGFAFEGYRRGMKASSETPKAARLLVVDDHAFMRVAINTILDVDDAPVKVVGEAKDGEEAIDLCRELLPDLILMDVSMPKMDGLEATRRIKAEFPQTAVLVLTSHADHGLMMEAVKAGAAGYVLKGENPHRILEAVRAVLEGETPLDQGLAMSLLRHLGEEAAAQTAARSRAERVTPESVATMPDYSLTPRETQVLVCLASGKTNRQIAKELHLSLSTVKRHLEHILPKLKVSDRTQAAVKAVEMGLLPPAERGEGTTP
jgi:DNA-binding NarL/FixJ family response regulator